MVRSCFHVGCTSGYSIKKHGPSHLFKIPKGASEELRKRWIQNIPKQVGRVFDLENDRICHLHFEEDCVVKEHFVCYKNDKVPQGPRKHWTLQKDSIPTKFSNAKVSSTYDRKHLKRKSPIDRTSAPPVKKKKDVDPGVSVDPSHEVIDPLSHNPNTVYPLTLLHEGMKIDLPETWQIQVRDNGNGSFATIFELGEHTDNYFIEMKKYVRIFQNHTTTEINVALDGRKLTKFDGYLIKDLEDVSRLIRQIDSMPICTGVPHYGSISECRTGAKRGSVWYSTTCKVQVDEKQEKCEQCSRLRATLRMSQNRLKVRLSVPKRLKFTPALPGQAIAYVKSLRRRMSLKNQHLRRSQRKSSTLTLTMNFMRKRMKQEDESTLLQSIMTLNIPENMKTSMRTAIKNAKRKTTNGNRFEAGWLLQCLLLKIKSPKAYRHLKANNVLPLPHPSTLQRLISGIPCEFGFTEFVFDQLRKGFFGKTKKEREGIVMFDEIKVREEISYDKIKMQFHGFIDYGTECDNTDGSSKMADHALVFMFKSHYTKIIQPLGSFATRGAASGETLAKLLISCIVRLESAHARISAVVSDGATTNKNMWKLLGISGSVSQFSNKIDHPCEIESSEGQKRYLYFCSDVPHVMKCIRNHFFKHQLVWFNGVSINSGFYKAAYDVDTKLTNGLRIIPKVTQAHIKPNAFQKMRVYLATQVFSKSMADAIRFYRNQDEPFLRGSDSTEDFTRTINNLFDALNACYTSVAVRLNSKEYKIIDEFKTQIFRSDKMQTFASAVTLDSLRVTLQSFLDLINYLVKEVGFKYVLTGKINQDSLERFFGILRQVAGDEDHPSIISFMHLYRLLCLYTPTSKLVHGNVNKGDDAPVAMSSYVDVLLKNSKIGTEASRSKRLAIDDKIMKLIVSEHSAPPRNNNHLQDHDYCKLEPGACIVYQLCGYMAHRVQSGNQFTTCRDCKSSVSSYEESLSLEASLTKIRSLGSLQFPSPALYQLVNDHVEPKISEGLQGLHVDLVNSIVDNMSDIPSAGVGCGKEAHNEILVVSIISFYISIRMYFFAKNFNRQIVSSRTKTKQQRKLSKLN